MRRRWTLSLLAACLALACQKRFAAVLQVEVETDLADAAWLELRTRSQDGARITGRDQRPWPAGELSTFNLVPLNDDLAANPDAVFEVVAASCGPEGAAVPARCVLVGRRMRVRYRAGEVRRVHVALGASCRSVVCDAGMTCADGRCVDERWEATDAADGGAVDGQVATADVAEAAVDVQVTGDIALEDRATAADITDAPVPDTGACPIGQMRCGASCVDPRVDTAHCGRCDRACPAGVACGAGSCVAAREVSVLDGEACALLTDDTVRCWGAAFGGVFGVASDTGHRMRPFQVAGVTGRSGLNVSTSRYHCVVASETEVTCWGTGGVTTRALTTLPYPIAQLQCGVGFCCMRLGSGSVGCWGDNSRGQLGDGTLVGRTEARPVLGVTTARDLSCGTAQCCVALADGSVRCWGANVEGQFGNGTIRDVQSTPVAMRGVSGVTKVGTGATVSCVLTQVGAVRCVGGDWAGQLGDGPGDMQVLDPVSVPTLTSGVTDLRVGPWNACVRKTDGSLWCWGSNLEYQSGGATRGAIEVPTRIDLPSGLTVSKFNLGYSTTCAVLSDGSVRCWGRNVSGQLGNGTRDAVLTPTRVTGLSAVRAIAAGQSHNCAISGNEMRCWGDNFHRQLGVGTADRGTPSQAYSRLLGTPRMFLGTLNSCLALDADTWRCAGATNHGQLALDPSRHPATTFTSTLAGLGIIELGLGTTHGCGRTAGNGLMCWGLNNEGQLGLGTMLTPAQPTPTTIPGYSDIVRVVAGHAFSCALRTGGDVLCWGANQYGQLGVNDTAHRATPTRVILADRAAGLFAGVDHACALLPDGSARCWGSNRDGCLGDNTNQTRLTPVPVNLPAGVRIRSMSLGQAHTCAVTTTNELYCWGRNRYGELGAGREVSSAFLPQRVTTGIEEIAAGWTHTCARRNDGTVWCWGANDLGQLGNGLPEHPVGGFAVRF